MVSSFLMFLDHTQRLTTVGRTPLDVWSARRRDLYLTTHDTHNRQTSMPLVGFKPAISVGELPQTYVLDRAATGTGQQYATIQVNLLFLASSTCFGRCFAHHQEHLTVFTVSASIHTSSCRLVFWMSWNCVSTHPKHQPAATWVNTTRYCKYGQVLLMMGENNARNL